MMLLLLPTTDPDSELIEGVGVAGWGGSDGVGEVTDSGLGLLAT
jgi:hypothetical protein